MGPKPKRAIDVFLSSDQSEFSRERIKLAERVTKLPYLSCTPLEKRGAEADDIVAASLRGVRGARVFVGIFGSKYSETTIKEYWEAVRLRRPSYHYVKKVRRRDPRLKDFIERELKNRFKYDTFMGPRDLYRKVTEKLEDFTFDLISRGLSSLRTSQAEVRQLETVTKQRAKTVSRRYFAFAPQARITEALGLLKEAELSYAHGSYLASLVSSWSALETALRATVRKAPGGRPGVYQDLTEVVARARAVGIITSREQGRLRYVTHARNAAAYSGRQPSKSEARLSLEVARDLLRRLAE